jgi:hypothetical protein
VVASVVVGGCDNDALESEIVMPENI